MGRPILLIDDDSAHRRLFRRAAQKANVQVDIVEAETLARAQALLHGATPDSLPCLIILDLNLIDGRGTSLIPDIRAILPERVPVLVLSTSTLESDREESLRLGADEYLVKTADPTAFRNRVITSVLQYLQNRSSQ